jgi:hypothetical protein
MSFKDSLNAAASQADSKEKTDNYQLLLDDALSRKSADDLHAFVVAMLDEKTPLFVSRALLHSFADGLTKLSAQTHKDVALFTLSTAQVCLPQT